MRYAEHNENNLRRTKLYVKDYFLQCDKVDYYFHRTF